MPDPKKVRIVFWIAAGLQLFFLSRMPQSIMSLLGDYVGSEVSLRLGLTLSALFGLLSVELWGFICRGMCLQSHQSITVGLLDLALGMSIKLMSYGGLIFLVSKAQRSLGVSFGISLGLGLAFYILAACLLLLSSHLVMKTESCD